jgi:hypothetical protein
MQLWGAPATSCGIEFILVSCVMQEILEIAEDLSQALRKKSQDIVNAMRLVFSTKSSSC